MKKNILYIQILFLILINSNSYASLDLNQLKNVQQFELETLQIVSTKNNNIENWSLLIEFKTKPTPEHLQNIRKLFYSANVQLFDNIKSTYFERLYKLTFQGTLNFKNNVVQTLKNITEINKDLNLANIEETYRIDAQSIIPNESNRNILISDDLFTPYLWALENREQMVLKDLDDIHLEKVKGKIGVDIGIKNIYKKIDSQIKNDVLVAVIDSGVDIDHPDLKDGIAKNLVECENGSLPFKPKEDKDKNGYIGDCMGWSFVSTKKEGDERPYDDAGHGTHLAGIIAATINNKLGVAGVSSKIKIVPVKVLQKNENPMGVAGGLATGGPSDRIAKGILYAIKRNVQVINLSMGWPISVDTKYLRMSILEAQNRGIVIVAAAGNNTHSGPIFPCAYPNVLCVGAVDASGNFANFSNYGGHVDLLAPGDNILSTYPQKLTANFFAVKGYEIKNGTSQAAPYVAAAVAILKGLNNQISFNEIFARLFVGSNKVDPTGTDQNQKYSLYGLLNIEKSINAKKLPVVIPLLKKVEEIIVQTTTKNFNLTIPIKNLWADAKDIKISFDLDQTAKNSGIILKSKDFFISNLQEGETKDLTLEGEIKDNELDNTLSFNIKISSSSTAEKTFNHQIRIVTSLDNDPHFLEIVKEVVTDPAIKTPIAIRKGDETRTTLSTISDPFFQNPYPQYYVEQKFDKGTTIFIFKTDTKNTSAPFNAHLKLTIPDATSLLSVALQDVNYDGKLEYVIITIAKVGEEKFIEYSYFNSTGSSTFGKYNHFRFVPETAIVNYKKVTYIPYKSSILKGLIAIPFFYDYGKTPEKDLNKDPFEENSSASKIKDNHFFYITPTKAKDNNIHFETRIVDNYKWMDLVKNKLNLAWDDSIDMVDILPQSLQDYKKGIGTAIISVGKNYLRNYYLVTFKPQYTDDVNSSDVFIESFATSGVHLEGSFLFPITNLDLLTSSTTSISTSTSPHINAGAMFVGHETNTNVRLSMFDYLKQGRSLTSTLYSHPQPRDYVLSAFACYKKDDDYYAFLQSKSSLLLERITSRGESYIYSRPITRFSFLPGSLYNEIFYPIFVSNPARPALYVDATEINRKDIYVLSIDEDKNLISPIKFNIRVPTNCKSLNPTPIGERQQWAYTLLCENQKKWFLHYLILK
ncbi:MAG: S8 family serine peptidase [Oligoflexia bacterium]|nr:S8 family serine peptidase [Oligoflexia bacterium]